MAGSPIRLAGVLLFWGTFALAGCTGRATVLDLSAQDSVQDQWKIAQYYGHEAARLRQQYEEQSVRVAVYERLFGVDSEWVAGARLLAQFYEDAAQEQERLASLHLDLARTPHERQTPSVRLTVP